MAGDKPPLWTGDDIDGWHVERVIARGGMAWVYHVTHPERGVAALKVLDPGLLSDASKQRRWTMYARFRREGRIQSRLRHDNIVAVYDTVDVAGTPALLMELVDGPALDELLEQRELAVEEIDAIAGGIFAGLQSSHEEGVLHRDLKPSNILLSTSGTVPVAKVTDFGIAKDQASEHDSDDDLPTELTRTGQVMGTPSYMAPMQATDSKHVDESVDVYALGILLHELCTRRRIAREGRFLEGPDVEEALRKLRRERRLPRRFVRAIEGALADDPAFDSVAGMAAVWRGGRVRSRTGARGLVLAAVVLVAVAAWVGWAGQIDLDTMPGLATLGEWLPRAAVVP